MKTALKFLCSAVFLSAIAVTVLVFRNSPWPESAHQLREPRMLATLAAGAVSFCALVRIARR